MLSALYYDATSDDDEERTEVATADGTKELVCAFQGGGLDEVAIVLV